MVSKFRKYLNTFTRPYSSFMTLDWVFFSMFVTKKWAYHNQWEIGIKKYPFFTAGLTDKMYDMISNKNHPTEKYASKEINSFPHLHNFY